MQRQREGSLWFPTLPAAAVAQKITFGAGGRGALLSLLCEGAGRGSWPVGWSVTSLEGRRSLRPLADRYRDHVGANAGLWP